MKLNTVANLLERIGFDSINTVELLAGESLEAATLELENVLRFPTFARASYDDRFSVREITRYALGNRTVLNLSMGMIVSGSIAVYEAASPELMDATDGPTLIEDFNYEVNEDKGRIVLSNIDVAHKTLKVTYDAGLLNVDGTADLYDDVAPWLANAALTQAIIRMDTINPTLRHDDKAQAELSISQMREELRRSVAMYIRYFADGLYPINV
jgi:hypothetical protein